MGSGMSSLDQGKFLKDIISYNYNDLKKNSVKIQCLRGYATSKKTVPWNGHSSEIFPSQKPDGISKCGNNVICIS